VILERRSRTLLELSQEISQAHDSISYWYHAIQVLSRNGRDLPFVLLYSAQAGDSKKETDESSDSASNHHQCALQGSIGLPNESPADLTQFSLNEDHGFVPYFEQALIARQPTVINLEQDSEAAKLTQGIQWQGFGDPCREAVVCPLHSPSLDKTVLGFIVIGISKLLPIICSLTDY
jgi:hypothetical protein